MNNFKIIESSKHKNEKWITYVPNNDKFVYGILMNFIENHSLSPIKIILNNKTNFSADNFITNLVCRKEHLPKITTDLPRKLTLEEFLILKQIIEKSNYKYNKKKKCLTEN